MTEISDEGREEELAEAVARRVIELLREDAQHISDAPRLMTVAQVSREFGLSADWIYSHAEQLGVIRMGGGPRARLRFDRATIGSLTAGLSNQLQGRHEPVHAERARTDRLDAAELLPILGQGRKLGGRGL